MYVYVKRPNQQTSLINLDHVITIDEYEEYSNGYYRITHTNGEKTRITKESIIP